MIATMQRSVVDEESRKGGVVAYVHRGRCAVESPTPHTEHPALVSGSCVAICTYKRPANLRRLLDSLLEQEEPPSELLIVDASPDEATERMLRDFPRLDDLASCIRYYRVRAPLAGLTRQRNFALRWVASETVTFLDDDIVLLPGCLGELTRVHRESAGSIVGVGAYILNEHGAPSALWRIRALLGIVPSLRPGSYSRSGMSVPWSFLPPTDDVVDGDWLLGGATMWRTDLARELGFNESFEGYANGEDREFSLGMARRGRIVVAGGAKLLHMHDGDGRPDAYQMGYAGARNAFHIHRACFGRGSWLATAYFLYAFTMDTLIRVAALVRLGDIRLRWSFVRGRLRFLRGFVTGSLR